MGKNQTDIQSFIIERTYFLSLCKLKTLLYNRLDVSQSFRDFIAMNIIPFDGLMEMKDCSLLIYEHA